jgi:hypothetical protein
MYIKTALMVLIRIILYDVVLDWYYVAINHNTRNLLNNLVAKDGKFAGYKKYELLEMALNEINHS